MTLSSVNESDDALRHEIESLQFNYSEFKNHVSREWSNINEKKLTNMRKKYEFEMKKIKSLETKMTIAEDRYEKKCKKFQNYQVSMNEMMHYVMKSKSCSCDCEFNVHFERNICNVISRMRLICVIRSTRSSYNWENKREISYILSNCWESIMWYLWDFIRHSISENFWLLIAIWNILECFDTISSNLDQSQVE